MIQVQPSPYQAQEKLLGLGVAWYLVGLVTGDVNRSAAWEIWASFKYSRAAENHLAREDLSYCSPSLGTECFAPPSLVEQSTLRCAWVPRDTRILKFASRRQHHSQGLFSTAPAYSYAGPVMQQHPPW